MKSRLSKEFRPLMLPWALAAIAAGVAPIKLLIDDAMHPGEFWTMVLGIVPFAFFGSIVALGASSFGAEFQHRTLPLLLAQPLRRERMWSEKLLVLAGAMVSVVLIYFAFGLGTSLVAMRWFGSARALLTPTETLLVAMFLVATVCSAGFWTLKARSLLGGMTFCIGAQFILAIGVNLVLERIYRNNVGGLEDPVVLRWAIVMGLLYLGLFLWLGWRNFAGLQLKAAGYGEGAMISTSPGEKEGIMRGAAHLLGGFLARYSGWLRCRPKSATLNLIRKELRLEKPLFVMAAVFTICWLATLVLLLLSTQGERQEVYETILNVLTGIWVVLMALLAGSVSLGEEKAMGMAEWPMTLPVSARRQWLTKLSVAAGVGVVLGIGLPLGLAVLTSVKSKVGLFFLVSTDGEGLPILLNVWGLFFVLGFWAATLLGSTVRAVLNSIVVLVGLGMVAALGARIAQEFDACETWLILPLMIHFRLAPNFFVGSLFSGLTLVTLFLAPVVLTALIQSFRQFRRAQPDKRLIWKYSMMLLGVSFVVSGWGMDLGRSWVKAGSELNQDLERAVIELPEGGLSPVARKVSLAELEQTGKLSPAASRWLSGAKIDVASTESKGGFSERSVTIQFPDGLRFGELRVRGKPERMYDNKER